MRFAVIAIIALLGAIIALEWTLWSPRPPRPQRLPPAQVATPPPAASPAELIARLDAQEGQEHYAQIIERPIFRPDRRPPPPPDAQAGQPSTDDGMPLDALDLQAILIAPGVAMALVHDPSQPKPRRLRVGDEVQGWVVTAIKEDRILVERQGQQDALLLRDYSKTPPALAPAPKPAPPRNPPRPPLRVTPRTP